MTRKYYLDWLRVGGILFVLVYHSTRFFNNEEWHVKNPLWYPSLDAWNSFAVSWMMPLMFVISGASLFFSVGKGGAGKFIKDKVLRLLVPLIVCMFTHGILQVYLERITHGQFSGSFFQFLPHYFQGIYDGANPTSGNFALTGMHLWYLLVLFIFSLILYPLMRWLKGKGQRALTRLDDLLAIPAVVFVLALPTLLFFLIVDPGSPAMEGNAGWPFLVYLWLVFSGFVVISSERLQESIRRQRWLTLAVAAASMGSFFLLLSSSDGIVFGTTRFALIVSLRVFMSWSLVLTFLGFGIQHLNMSNPFLTYANEAVLPFYILHQTVLLVVGYFVVQWHVPDLFKWVVILVVSFGIIMLIYEFLVRRFNGMRFLFGMKPLARRPVVKVVEPQIEEAERVA